MLPVALIGFCWASLCLLDKYGGLFMFGEQGTRAWRMLTRRLSPPPLRPGGSSICVSELSPVLTRTVHRPMFTPDVGGPPELRARRRHGGRVPPTETLLVLSVGGPLTTSFLNVRQAPTGLLAGPGRA